MLTYTLSEPSKLRHSAAAPTPSPYLPIPPRPESATSAPSAAQREYMEARLLKDIPPELLVVKERKKK